MSKPKYESVAKKYEIYGKYYALTKFRIDDTDGKKTLIITELKGTANGSETNPEYKYSLENVEIPNFNGSIYHISNNEYGTDAEFTIVPEKVTVTQLNEYETGVKRITDRTNAQNAANKVVSGIFDAADAAAKKAEQDAAKLKAEQEAAKLKAEQDAEAAKLKAAEEEAAKLKAADDAEYKKQQLRLEEDAKQAELDAAKKAEEKRQLTEAYKSAMEAVNTQMKAFTQLYEQAKQLKTEAAALFNKDSPTEQDLQQANEKLTELQRIENDAKNMAKELNTKLEAAGKARDAANSYNTQNQLSGDKAIKIEDANWQNTQKTAISNMLKGIQTYITDVEQAKKDAANKVKKTYDSAMEAFNAKMKAFNQLYERATKLKTEAATLSDKKSPTEDDLNNVNKMLDQLKDIQTTASNMTKDLNTKLTDAVNARAAANDYNTGNNLPANKAIPIESAEWKGQQTSDIEGIPTYIQEHINNVDKKVNEIREAVEKEKQVKAIKEINESLTPLKSVIEKENKAKTQVAEAETRVQDAEKKVEKETQEQEKIQNEIEQIDKQIKDSESKQKDLNKNMENAQKVYEDAKTELKTLQTDNKELTEIMSKYGIKNAVKGNTTLQDKINGLIIEKSNKIKEINTQKGNETTKLERISKYTTEIAELNTHLRIAKDASEKKEKEKELAKTMKDKETAIKKLENQVKTEKQTFDKLNEDKTRLEKTKQDKNNQIQDANNKLQTEQQTKSQTETALKTATEAVTEAKKATTQKIGELEKLLPQGDQKNSVSGLKGNIEKATVDSIGGIQFTLDKIQTEIDSSKKKGGKTQRRRNPHRSTKKRSHSEKPI